MLSSMRRFWHPVCTREELRAASSPDSSNSAGPLGVQLCGESLVVVDLGAGPVAMRDRCPHRSTRLSLGWVDEAPSGAALQCAYHGWRWDAEGRCAGIPSMPQARPGAGLPARRVPVYETQERYGLVWVRLEPGWPTQIPACPGYDDETMRAVPGAPYTWPVGVERRVENFTDLAHFAWVHDGSLGRRDHPEVPIPQIRREGGALRFSYLPPALPDSDPTALLGDSHYTVSLPGSVDIQFDVAGAGRRALWMTAAPIDAGSCRTFWFTCRSDDLDGDDAPHLAFQALVLAEDEPVVRAQHPPAVPWAADDPDREISVRTDAVSLAYRRFLLDAAATDTPQELAEVLRGPAPVPVGPSR